jgi:outer membrane autotransporter protein
VSGFTESPSSDPASLKVGSQSGDSLASVLGARVQGHWGRWSPEISAAWQYEFLNPVQSVTNAFAAAPGTAFTVDSSDPGRSWALVNVGTTFAVTPSSDFSVSYDGRFASGYSSSAVVGRWDTRF